MPATNPQKLIPNGDKDIGLGFLGLNVPGSNVGSFDRDTRILLQPGAYLLVKELYSPGMKLRKEGLYTRTSPR